MIWDNHINKNLEKALRILNQLKHMSYKFQFCITITSAYKKKNYELLLTECGLKTLKSRQTAKKLVLMFKIQNKIASKYLCDICPTNVGLLSNYGLRSINNIQICVEK